MLFRHSVLLDVVLTGNWQGVQPRAQRGAEQPTSESHPGKLTACWYGYIATGLLCHLSLIEKRKKKGFEERTQNVHSTL